MDKDFNKLLKRYNASQKLLEQTIEKLNKQRQQIEILEAEKRQWVEQKILQNHIIQQQLGNSDNVVRQIQNEILNLKEKIKET